MKVDIGGCKLFFDVEGAKLRPDGPRMREVPTLVLLHGGPGLDHSMYKPLFGSLSDVAQIIYLDYRGNGRSDRSTSEFWNLKQWADDVKALCDALEIMKPIVFGNSFGGMVAMAYAARYPDHPAKLVLVSTRARLRPDRVVLMLEKLGGTRARDVAQAYFDAPSPETIEEYGRVCMPLYNPSRALAESGWTRRMVLNREVAEHFRVAEWRTLDLFPLLSRIKCPTLILAGELDPNTTLDDMRDLAAAIPTNLVRFEQFPDAGHGVFRDSPDRAMEALREFIVA